MSDLLLLTILVFLILNAVLSIVIILRSLNPNRTNQFAQFFSGMREDLERMERSVREESARNREESSQNASRARGEMSTSLASLGTALRGELKDIAILQKNQLDSFARQLGDLTQLNEHKLENLRNTVEQQLKSLQEDNTRKLEQMRQTVDEKLHATLEQRLGESFKIVSERLEQVHKGLGEMQVLASGVGDLKKVLSNVKTRGTWGEIQLGNILEQILTIDQYTKNVSTKRGTNDRVEYAIKLPGRDSPDDAPVWLPIDSKFPQDDYQRLVDAQEQGNPALIEDAGKVLEMRVRGEAKSIAEKYLDPPGTTDFAIMFLPTEGLYAEVLRRPGLADMLQREHRVVIAGPTTLAAILNSLQMGFRTLAIERRSSEVWSLLGAVKTEFGRFGEVLDRTQKKLQEASNTIEHAAVRSRAIERKLKDVQQLPAQDATNLLGSIETDNAD